MRSKALRTLSKLAYFYRQRFRARRLHELFALIGLAVGVALLFSVQVSSTSLSASVEQLTKSFFGNADMQLVARDPHGIDQDTWTQLTESPDVDTAVPVLIVPANVSGPRGDLSVTVLAAGPGLSKLDGSHLSRAYRAAPLRADTVALASSVAQTVGASAGDTVKLAAAGRMVDAVVAGTIAPDDFQSISDTATAFVSLHYAQDLARLPGRVSRVYVRAQPGRERAVEELLQRVAGDRADVRPVGFDAEVFAQAALPNDQSTGLFAWISAFVGFLFAFNALLLIANQRRELVKALRRYGFSRRSAFRIVLGDALVLGFAAAMVGLVLGEFLSREVFPPSPGYLALAFPVGVGRVVSWHTIAIAIGAGMFAAILATLLAVTRRASKSPRTRLVGSWWSFGGGLGFLVLAAVVPVSAPGAAVVGMLALIASMLLWLRLLLKGVLWLVDKFGRWRSSTIPVLAVGSLRSSMSRAVAVTAIAAVALLAVVAIEGSRRDLQRGLDKDVHELSAVSDLWVSATGASNALATTPFDLSTARQIRRLPEVAAVHVQRGGFLDIGNRRVWVLAPPRQAPTPVPTTQILTGDPATATARLREHGWAAVSQALADDQHLHVGQTFTLNAPRPTRLRLAAIISNLGWTPGTIVINADDYAAAWQSSDASALRVDLAPGTDPSRGRQLLQQTLGTNSGLHVETAGEREQRQRETARQGLSRLTQIAYLVLGAAALAMAASMGAMVLQRRHELAALKIRGIKTRRIRSVLLLETAVLLGTGCTAGALYGLAGAHLLDSTLTTVTGFPVSASLAIPTALLSYLILATTAFTIAAFASNKAAAVPPRTALQTDLQQM